MAGMTASLHVRMRLTFGQAQILSEAISSYRHKVIIQRAAAKDEGKTAVEFNYKVRQLDRAQEELRRAAAEQGWLIE